jgi:uracil-DNA glycosylase
VGALPGVAFNPHCTRCPRLGQFLAQCREERAGYHGRPVAPFGAGSPCLLIVGLAPGLHGANRTGRPFTGDFAGVLLYETLHRFGLASAPRSTSLDDGLQLRETRITNAVKCVPPANKPTPAEIRTCNAYLAEELRSSPGVRAVLALGRIAHEATLRALGLGPAAARFSHGAEHALPGGAWLVDSYHCSRYNTQTRRLTPAMFEAAVGLAARHAGLLPEDAAR